MTRSVVLASVLFAACTDADIGRVTIDPRASGVDDFAVGEVPPRDPRCVPFDRARETYGTTDHDELRDVVVTASGSILVAGYEGGAVNDANGSRGVVLEYGPNGFTSRATLDTLGTDTFESLAIAPDTGRIWLAARTNGGISGLPNYGSFDFVVGDLDGGAFRPMERGFDVTPEYPKQLAAAAGALAIAGHEYRLMPDGMTWTNPFLATFATTDDVLSPQWLTARRNAPSERYSAVAISARMIVTGVEIADGSTQGTYVHARNLDGGIEWQQQLSSYGTNTIAALQILDNGDVMWAGAAGDEVGGTRDIAVGRLDGASGDQLWTVRYGGASSASVADMAVTSDHIFIGGDIAGTDRDAFLLVLDDEGGFTREERWTSNGDDVPTAIAVDACGTAVLAGHTTGAFAGSPHGGRDAFVIVTPSTPR